MDRNAYDQVRHRTFKGQMLGLKFVPQPNLAFKGGAYDFREGQVYVLHPLDYTLLFADDPMTGDWLVDLQRVLGVSPAWINGFMEGFAEGQPSEVGEDYAGGYGCGQAVLSDLRRFGQVG